MTHTNVWSCSPDVAFVDDGVRVALVDLSDLTVPEPRVLIDSAAVIWRTLAEVSDQDAIVERVASHFEVAPTSIEDDVRLFLDELRTQGLALLSAL